MIFAIDIATTNKTTGEIDVHDLIILDDECDEIDAVNKLEDIIENLPKNVYAHHKKVIRIVVCECGEMVHCTKFTNTCVCGKDYNFAGDLLAPREQWGEETGEHWTDCY